MASVTLAGAVFLSGSLRGFAGEPDNAEYRVIPAATPAELTPANGWPSQESYRLWTRSLGGPTSNHYSSLAQINRSSVGRLKVAWTYHSGDGAANLQCNPIIAGGLIFVPTAGGFIAALKADTGTEVWRFDPGSHGGRLEDQPARRGLLYWPGDEAGEARILFAAGNWIYAIDPAQGNPIKSFGVSGRVELPTGGTVAGAIWQHTLVVPGYTRDVFGYDLISGRQVWRFHTIPQPGEYGYDTWSGQETGANCWGGMAMDESRGIAYLSTGSPKPNYNGTHHLGDDLFGNCVLALDVATGKRLWHFQEIRHDIWDLDPAAPPNLVTVRHDGRLVDAVAQVTKIGNTLLLDRVTGKPLFPFRLRRAPATKLEGEATAEFQPFPDLPQPFVRHSVAFSADDITDRTPAAHDFVEALVRRANVGWFEPFEAARPTVYYGMHGGAEWTGAGFDPATGRLYVSSNELPWSVMMIRDDDPPPVVPATAGERLYQANCAACHGPTRRGTGMVPPLLGLRHRLTEEQILALLQTGRSQMPPAPQLPLGQRRTLVDFLLARDRPASSTEVKGGPRYVFGGYSRVLDQDGYPGIKPPWGTMNCLDLNSGRIVWQVPLGEYPELTKAGIPKTGTENFGGPLVTAGGLVFCSGTRDNRIRAFDALDGSEVWSALLPLHGTAPPASYEVKGQQYIVVAATGGGKLGGPMGDSWIAFTLAP